MGASLLDWAIMKEQTIWSVTILQAAAQMDAGAIGLRTTLSSLAPRFAKSSVYRRQVTKAAVHGVLEGRLQLSC